MTKKEKKEMDLEELLAQTEEKITNNEYYEDVDIEYKNMTVHVRIKPISQSRFVQISKNKGALKSAQFNTELIHACVLNKRDNKPFTKEQIEELFTGGLAGVIAIACCKVSGIATDPKQMKELQNF